MSAIKIFCSSLPNLPKFPHFIAKLTFDILNDLKYSKMK